MWKILNKKKKYDDVSYLEGFPIYFILACGHLFVYFRSIGFLLLHSKRLML